MKIKFDVTAEEFKIIQTILNQYLPTNCKVWVFGSRAKNTARHNSDLDLALEYKEKLNSEIISKLKDAFNDAPIAFSIDIVNMLGVEDYFREIIEQQKVVFPLSSRVPELRFSEFNDNWANEPIGNLCDFVVPGRNKPKLFEGDIPWITTPDLRGNLRVKHSKEGLCISSEEAKLIGSKIVPKNSIIFSCVGELGTISVAEVDLIINQQLHAFLPKEKILTGFLTNSLLTRTKYIERVATRTSIPYLNKDNCNSIPIIYPSLKEQHKIADFLSSVDNKISLLTEKQRLLQRYKKGVMQKLFPSAGSGQVPELRFKDDQGNNFPDWEEKKLGDIAKLTSSKRIHLSDYVPDGIPFYRGKEISELRLNKIPDDILYISNEMYEEIKSKYAIPKIDDILITAVGTLGNIYRVNSESPFYFKDGNLIWLQNISENSSFLELILEYHHNKILISSIGSTQKALTIVELNKLKFLFPSNEEQQKIANFIIEIDKKIYSVTQQIVQTKTFKKGLLQKMFV